jgi:hypothetical protein
MPKKPKKPNNNSQESTLGPFAKAVSDIDADKPSADKPTEAEPAEPAGSGGDGEGEVGKGEAPPEGETSQEGG